MNDTPDIDPRLYAIPDIHGHAKGEHKPYAEERPIPLSARMLFLWFFHACRRGWPRFVMVSDHMNYLTFEDPAAVNLVRRALKLAQAGDLYGAAETASVEVGHAAVVSEGLRRGMRYAIGAEVDNDPRARPDAQNIVDAMKPDGMIRSVHFLPIEHPVHGPNWNWAFDNPEFKDLFDVVGTEKTWELYVTTLLDAIERLPGHIVGHFYVPATFGHWPDDATLEKYEDRVIEACEARGMAIEFNTRFLYRDNADEEKQKYLRAYERLLKKAKARNIGIAVGSDAHSPKDQGGAFTTVLDVLDACEINEIVFPLAGRLARVALRVERKPEPEPPPPPPPPPPVPVPAAAEAASGDTKAVRKQRTTEPPGRVKEARPGVLPAPAAKSRRKAPAPAEPQPAEMQPALKPPEKPAAKAAPKPPAKSPAKPLPKAAKPPAKAAVKAAKPASRAAVKASAAKAKPAAKPAAKPTAKKPAAAIKAAPKKTLRPAKPPARTPAKKKAATKKAAPAKKPASAKKAVVKHAPAKKSAAGKAPGKKPAAKKPANKRR
ncbi:MAG: hypothetical protein ABR591_12070 [Candidatus Velthaea sp.]